MPSAAYKPPRAIADLDDAAATLRAEGLRFSASRRAILEGLLAAEGPVSAEYLADGLGGQASACDLPSAYRNLELFERLGMVRHVHIGHGPGLYALVTGEERPYLVCERCGRLSRLAGDEADAIRARIDAASGFQAHFTHFPILGLCHACAEGASADQSNPSEGATMTDHEAEGHGHEHSHDDAHTHEHSHDGETHTHPHDERDHDHVSHEHEHGHGDRVHSHPHLHQEGLEEEHEHSHED